MRRGIAHPPVGWELIVSIELFHLRPRPKRLKRTHNLHKPCQVNLSGTRTKEALRLRKAGEIVPDESIDYDDATIAADPDFDGAEWSETVTLTTQLQLPAKMAEWLAAREVDTEALATQLVRDFVRISSSLPKQ